MMRSFLILKLGVLAAGLALTACGANETKDSFSEEEVSAMREQMSKVADNPNEWVTNGGDFTEKYYSRLDQINTENVDDLGFAWEFATNTTRGLEASPVVVDGRMFTTGTWGQVWALDAKTGKELWYFNPEVEGQIAGAACCDIVNRGVAYWDGIVYVAALDGNLFALDAKTGKQIWKTPTFDEGETRLYTSTGAPQIAGDVVVIGNGGADFDVRGYFGGYDLKTGEMRWRFYTVPGSPDEPYEHPEMEMAAKTWDPDSRWDLGGGGTAWDSIIYDPELDLLYVGTGNSALYPQEYRSPKGGDNLFVASILAIKPSTGKMEWYYQVNPGESWDYTATQNMILADLEIDGKKRKTIMQAPKNGIFYVLDRETGELLSAENFVPVNWTSGVDMKTGKPVLTDRANYFREPKIIWPAAKGGHGWRPMAMNEQTGLVYMPVYEDAMLTINLFPDGYEYRKGEPNGSMVPLPVFEAAVDYYAPILKYDTEMLKEMIRNSDAPPRRALLRAWDPIKQETAWEIEQDDFRDGGGVMTTAGGLVFQSAASGKLNIYDAKTGKLLKAIETGSGMMASPSTYMVDGVQYVAVMAGLGGGGFFSFPTASAPYTRGNNGRLLVFKLGGGETPLPPLVEQQPFPEPPARIGDASMILEGHELFLFNCSGCHANNGPGILPDLRRLAPEKHEAFDTIVLEGVFAPNGMPSFAGRLEKKQSKAIHAYLIDLAWKRKESELRKKARPDMAAH